MWNRLIFQCDCFARFVAVLRHLARDYDILPHSKAEVGTNQGVGLIACLVITDTNLRGLARVENVERNGEF